jgi:hypothetical protein
LDVPQLGEELYRLISADGVSGTAWASSRPQGPTADTTRYKMSLLTRLRAQARPGLEATEYLRALEARGAGLVSRPPRPSAAPPPTPDQVATREQRVRLVAEDVDTGERVVLAERVPWRNLEVLGAAAKYYATHYDNPDRPPAQVRARRDRASKLGASIWEAAEAKVGIEAPLGRD